MYLPNSKQRRGGVAIRKNRLKIKNYRVSKGHVRVTNESTH